MEENMEAEGGLFCSTANRRFEGQEQLRAHYRTDWHRYNLKRKVVGLPPVTEEWFNARAEKILAAQRERDAKAAKESEKTVWICPISKKKFSNEKTWDAWVQSKKFTQLMKKHGSSTVPEPIIKSWVVEREEQGNNRQDDGGAVLRIEKAKADLRGQHASPVTSSADNMEEEEDSDGWETVSEGDSDIGEEWDVRQCLFDDYISDSLESNLEYMEKNFGFVLPATDCLHDPEGLIQYLGWKISVANLPLTRSGLLQGPMQGNRFKDKHAVQRHMIDKGACRMLFEGNEEEYEDYYEFDEIATSEGETALVPASESRYTLEISTNGVEGVIAENEKVSVQARLSRAQQT